MFSEIHKFKDSTDYSNNVPVKLSADKTRIISHAAPLNTSWPVKLINGYYLNGSMGANSAYLSVTIEEYNASATLSGSDLFSLIIEKDPFLEYYSRDDCRIFENEEGVNGMDTAKINDLIREGKLEEYFDRIK